MRRLSSLILGLLFSVSLFAQTSPHGDGFAVGCTDCHNTEGWKIDFKTLSFDHGTTKFALTGQHQSVPCRACHESLQFSMAGTECVDCHTDLHNQTVGPDCGRCHTTTAWIVNNITEIHQRSRFPLVGPHITADCYDCHLNASTSLLNWGPLGVECIDCHQADYDATTNPNHVSANFPTTCNDCHAVYAFSWSGAGFNHSGIASGCEECHMPDYNATTDPNHVQSGFSTVCLDCHKVDFTSWNNIDHSFFPLTAGHAINECTQCHPAGSNYASTSPVCASCHQSDYNGTTNPSHGSLGFPTDCLLCHTTNPGWKPAEFRDHDSKYFPIYSGQHAGTWDICTECHPNTGNYAQFTCISCHEHNQSEMNDEHGDVQGYEYNSDACYACHPTGSGEGSFNHNNSAFPLTGAHTTVECAQCHTNGYSGTSSVCYDCHTPDFNQSVNPSHTAINIPKDCQTCHTTNPGWDPATFPIHNNYYVLAGAHVQIANECATCHNGNYNSTPNTCIGCHQADYNQTNNPNHAAAQFPTTCTDCHNQNAWVPANWDHDGQYFPIYSGKHNGEWNQCSDCHKNSSNYAEFTCTTSCHPQGEMNSEHDEVAGYSYTSAACLNCHPNGNAPKLFRQQNNINRN